MLGFRGILVLLCLHLFCFSCGGKVLSQVDHALDLLERDNPPANSSSELGDNSPSRSSSSTTSSGFTNAPTGTPMTSATGGVTTGAIGSTNGLDFP